MYECVVELERNEAGFQLTAINAIRTAASAWSRGRIMLGSFEGQS